MNFFDEITKQVPLPYSIHLHVAFASCLVIQRSDGGDNLCSENNLVKIRDNFLGSKI